MTDITERLRSGASGTIEWRVQNPETRAYCISFTEWNGGERSARQWLDEEILARPESIFAKYEVARVVALNHRDRLVLEAADEIDRLRARLEWDARHPDIDGISCRDETIKLLDERVAELRARVDELEAARQKAAAIDKLARSMTRDWGRRDEAGYRFPDTVPLIISTRDACVPDDLVRQILGWADEEA